jgi:membrane fusion protein, heavy metal efflux system
MKIFIPLCLVLALASHAEDAHRKANTIVLDENGVKNLRIETVEAEETDFEETIFALGRVNVLPGQRAIVSSRIPGRAFSVLALPDQQVDENEELMWVESRQPGDPPPKVMLAAPMSGIISKVDIAVGQPITPDQSLIEIVNLDTVEASAQVPQHLASKLSKDQLAHIRLPAVPGKIFEAKLAHLGVVADSGTGTIEAAFHVPNPDKLLRPGLMAEFNIVVSKREGVVSVPRGSLQGDVASRFVYVKDFELPNAFVKTQVQVGQMNDRFIEITSGLLPADEVVTRGAYSLSFAGASSVSLKDALDAAHGHEHAEDGSEMTPEKKAEMEALKHGTSDDHDHAESAENPLWKYATGVLLVLLLISVFTKNGGAAAKHTEDAR